MCILDSKQKSRQKNSPRGKICGACDDKPTTRNSGGSSKMGIRTVSITRALIKYLLVRGISTRGHGRHQSSWLDAGVHPSAVDNPEAAGLHRFPTLPPHVVAMKNASRGECIRRAPSVVGPPTVSEICNQTRVRKQLIEITFGRVRTAHRARIFLVFSSTRVKSYELRGKVETRGKATRVS